MIGFLIACGLLFLFSFVGMMIWLYVISWNLKNTKRDAPEVALVALLFTAACAGGSLVVGAAVQIFGGA